MWQLNKGQSHPYPMIQSFGIGIFFPFLQPMTKGFSFKKDPTR